MSDTTPELIFFDMGNVLLHFDHEIACQNIAQATDVSIDQVRSVIFGDDGLQWPYESGELTSEEFYDEFLRQTGAQIEFARFCRAASDIFSLNLSIVPIVAQLRAAGHRLGILSNTCEMHWKFVTEGRYAILPSYFDVLALSYELKSLKPDEPIYRRAAEMANVSAEAIFYIDDRTDNVLGAKKAGYDAVQYVSAPQLANDLRERRVRFNY